MTDLEAALDIMNKEGYSLVKIMDGWEFAVSWRPPINPTIKFPLVTVGDCLRRGRFATPTEALKELFKRNK